MRCVSETVFLWRAPCVKMKKLRDHGSGAEGGGRDKREDRAGRQHGERRDRRCECGQREEERRNPHRGADAAAKAPDAARGGDTVFGAAGQRGAPDGEHRRLHLPPGGDRKADRAQRRFDLCTGLRRAGEA